MRFFSLAERGWVKNDQFRINILRTISPPVHMHHKKKIALEIATKIASYCLFLTSRCLVCVFVFLSCDEYCSCCFHSDWNKFHEIYGGVQTNVDSRLEEHGGIPGISVYTLLSYGLWANSLELN